MIKKIVKNLTSMALANAISLLFAFFATVYISRIIGVENYGKIGFVTAIMVYFDMFSNLGLETYATREVARNEDKLTYFVDHTISIRILMSVLLFGILLASNLVIDGSPEIRNLLLLYGLNLFFKAFAINWSFAAQHRMEFYGLAQVILESVYMAFLFVIVKDPKDLYYVPISFVIGTSIAILFSWFIQWKRMKRIRFSYDYHTWKGMLKISVPMILSHMVMRIYFNFNIILLGFMGREREVGLYSAAFKFIFLLIAVRHILITVSYPLLSKYFVESKAKLALVMQGFIKIAILFALPVTTGGIILAPELVQTVFGSEFGDAGPILQILLLTYLFMMINVVYPISQNAFNRQNTYFRVSLINSGANIIFNLILIYWLGLIGAAIATVLTDLLSLILYKRESNKTIPVKFFGTLLRGILPTAFMAIVLVFLPPWQVFLKIGIASLIYTVGLFLFKTFTHEEMKIIKELTVARFV